MDDSNNPYYRHQLVSNQGDIALSSLQSATPRKLNHRTTNPRMGGYKPTASNDDGAVAADDEDDDQDDQDDFGTAAANDGAESFYSNNYGISATPADERSLNPSHLTGATGGSSASYYAAAPTHQVQHASQEPAAAGYRADEAHQVPSNSTAGIGSTHAQAAWADHQGTFVTKGV